MFGLVASGCSSFSNLLELTDLFSKTKNKNKKNHRSFVYSTFALLMNLFTHNNFPLQTLKFCTFPNKQQPPPPSKKEKEEKRKPHKMRYFEINDYNTKYENPRVFIILRSALA